MCNEGICWTEAAADRLHPDRTEYDNKASQNASPSGGKRFKENTICLIEKKRILEI